LLGTAAATVAARSTWVKADNSTAILPLISTGKTKP
jgi:hypothetical protein